MVSVAREVTFHNPTDHFVVDIKLQGTAPAIIKFRDAITTTAVYTQLRGRIIEQEDLHGFHHRLRGFQIAHTAALALEALDAMPAFHLTGYHTEQTQQLSEATSLPVELTLLSALYAAFLPPAPPEPPATPLSDGPMCSNASGSSGVEFPSNEREENLSAVLSPFLEDQRTFQRELMDSSMQTQTVAVKLVVAVAASVAAFVVISVAIPPRWRS
jgi:hypothetical protein